MDEQNKKTLMVEYQIYAFYSIMEEGFATIMDLSKISDNGPVIDWCDYGMHAVVCNQISLSAQWDNVYYAMENAQHPISIDYILLVPVDDKADNPDFMGAILLEDEFSVGDYE